MKKIDYIISKIETAEEKLCQADNNLRYIKALQALKYWLIKLDSMLTEKDRESGKYSAKYMAYFYCGAGFSFFDRVQNSILEYNYGVRPF